MRDYLLSESRLSNGVKFAFGRRPIAASVALGTVLVIAGFGIVLGGAQRHPDMADAVATMRDPSSFEPYLRISQSVQSSAERCSDDLRALAGKNPWATARALELELTAPGADAADIAETAIRTTNARGASVTAFAATIAQFSLMQRKEEGAIYGAIDLMAREHATADRLCLARDAAWVAAAVVANPGARSSLGARPTPALVDH